MRHDFLTADGLSSILDPWVANLFGRIKGQSNGILLTV
jgi:hypothetical protein